MVERAELIKPDGSILINAPLCLRCKKPYDPSQTISIRICGNCYKDSGSIRIPIQPVLAVSVLENTFKDLKHIEIVGPPKKHKNWHPLFGRPSRRVI